LAEDARRYVLEDHAVTLCITTLVPYSAKGLLVLPKILIM